ncbi:protein rogdi homolog isoform 5-T7 [Macrochelys suwanniensis]
MAFARGGSWRPETAAGYSEGGFSQVCFACWCHRRTSQTGELHAGHLNDINLKMPRNNQLLHFTFREDKQWKLQQIQDARNHVNQAIYLLTNRDVNYQFKTGSEVLKLMDAVMLQLTRARNRLTTPATLTLPEIASSGLTKMFTPALPSDILVNFYINLNKLCLTVYQLHALQPNSTKNFRPTGGSILHNPGAMFECGSQRYEVSHVHKVECVVPWLNDALVFFTVSLQLCQQLKDKLLLPSPWHQCDCVLLLVSEPQVSQSFLSVLECSFCSSFAHKPLSP